MDLDKMIATLKAGGATEEEINQVVDTYTQAKYEPKTVVIEPEFYLESDAIVMLGKEEHRLRLMNVDDTRRALPKLIEFFRAMLAEAGDGRKVEEVLDEAQPMQAVGLLVGKMIEMNSKGEYPEWFAAMLEEVAILTSTEERKITAGFLISLPPSQFAQLLFKLIEVNKQDFLLLWVNVPPGIRSTISTLASQLTNAVRSLKHSILQLGSSNGTAASSGKPSTSSPSEKKRASRKRKSAAAA